MLPALDARQNERLLAVHHAVNPMGAKRRVTIAEPGRMSSSAVPAKPATGPPPQSAKAWLLLRLLAQNPAEFVDRVRTIVECKLDRGSPPASQAGTSPAELMRELSRLLAADVSALAAERAVREHEAAIAAAQRDLAARASFGTFHNADFALARLCYALCRALRPGTVVETGVAFGVTTSFILRAMRENGAGTLWSVDLPPLGKGAGQQVGTLVPSELRERWRLVRGSSRRVLPGVFQQAGPVDLFIHDSLHTYAHMTWEFENAWRSLRTGGVLVSDDVEQNRAFEEFAARRAAASALTAREEKKNCSYGVAVKTEPER